MGSAHRFAPRLATEAVVADLHSTRREAYAPTRDLNLFGLGMELFLAVLIGTTEAYRLLFVIDAISFVVFFCSGIWRLQKLIGPQETESTSSLESNWAMLMRDRRLPRLKIFVNT